MKIERKFLVKSIPADRYESSRTSTIRQFYIHKCPAIKVCSYNDSNYSLTYESSISRGYGRDIKDFSIDFADFSKLRNSVISDPFTRMEIKLIKNRRNLKLISSSINSVVDEIVIDGSTVQIVKVEFFSMKDAENFIAPEWFDKEVTNDPYYSSISLAIKSNSKS